MSIGPSTSPQVEGGPASRSSLGTTSTVCLAPFSRVEGSDRRPPRPTRRRPVALSGPTISLLALGHTRRRSSRLRTGVGPRPSSSTHKPVHRRLQTSTRAAFSLARLCRRRRASARPSSTWTNLPRSRRTRFRSTRPAPRRSTTRSCLPCRRLPSTRTRPTARERALSRRRALRACSIL